MKKLLIHTIILLVGLLNYAQNPNQKAYTLQECIAIALENNFDLKAAQLQAKRAKIIYQQSKADLLPSLNGNFNIGVNNGRSIDPFTNDFIDQELTFSNAGLSLDVTIFNGFRLLNAAKQNRLNNEAANMEIEDVKQDLVLRVTLAYLQVLNSKAILDLNKQRYAATKKQLKLQESFYENESGNPADYADIKGQLTVDETNILTSESAYNSAQINLLQLLNLEASITISTQDLMLEFEAYTFSAEEVFKNAIENLATFKASTLRVEAAKKGVSVAKGQFTPQISLFGGVNTNYSSVAETFSAIGTRIVETGDFVRFEDENIPVLNEQTNFEAQKISYQDQLDNNLNTVIGLSVNIPLFNGFRAKNNTALERINVEEAIVALNRTHQDIKNAISQVHFNMEIAFARYNSLLKQVEAYQESYRINEIRFNNGLSNFLNYITSKNNLDNAKLNLTNAQYEYMLRVRVLEYYRGQVFYN